MAAAGLALALSPVVTAAAAGAPTVHPAPSAPVAQSGGVVAGIVVHGRPWAGNPGG